MLPLMILAAFAGGGLWAGICGYLRAKGLLSEVLSTLLLNSVAGFWLQYLVFGVWHDPGSSNFPQSKPYPKAAVLPHIWSGRFHVGFFLALAGVALFWFVLFKTRWGFEMRAVGGNPEAAKRSGIPITGTSFCCLSLAVESPALAEWPKPQRFKVGCAPASPPVMDTSGFLSAGWRGITPY